MPALESAPRLTRRQVLRGSAAAGAGAILAACGREPTDPSRAGTATATAAATRIVTISTPQPTSPPVARRDRVTFLLKIDHGLRYPTAVATDPQGNVYVIDGDHHRIQKFDGGGRFLAMWGSIGDAEGQFVFRISGPIPGGIAVDGRGTVYVSDYYDRVQAFDPTGRFLLQWGSHGGADGQFSFPTGLAIDGQGMVYVGDAENHRVQKFDGTGRFVAKWGGPGSGDGEFLYPGGIAVNSRNEIVVGDADNSRIQVFDINGRFLRAWGSASASAIQPEGPPGLAADGDGNIYVSRNNGDKIEKFDASGRLLAMWGSTGAGDGEFIYPSGVAVDRQGSVYVVDVIGGRVQKFRPE